MFTHHKNDPKITIMGHQMDDWDERLAAAKRLSETALASFIALKDSEMLDIRDLAHTKANLAVTAVEKGDARYSEIANPALTDDEKDALISRRERLQAKLYKLYNHQFTIDLVKESEFLKLLEVAVSLYSGNISPEFVNVVVASTAEELQRKREAKKAFVESELESILVGKKRGRKRPVQWPKEAAEDLLRVVHEHFDAEGAKGTTGYSHVFSTWKVQRLKDAKNGLRVKAEEESFFAQFKNLGSRIFESEIAFLLKEEARLAGEPDLLSDEWWNMQPQ